MWEDLYASFWPYRIEVDELVPSPTEDRALVFVTVTATPIADWEGVPAGRPITWSIAAICDFAPDGRMRREAIYAGSAPIVLWSMSRMLDAAS